MEGFGKYIQGIWMTKDLIQKWVKCLHGIVVNILECDSIVSEVKLQSGY